MSDSFIVFMFVFCWILFEFFCINTVYFSNIDLFLDMILTKKKRFKLINHILEHYTIINDEVVYKK